MAKGALSHPRRIHACFLRSCCESDARARTAIRWSSRWLTTGATPVPTAAARQLRPRLLRLRGTPRHLRPPRQVSGQWPSGLTGYRDFGSKNDYESMVRIVDKNGRQYCVFRRIDEDQEFDVLMSIKDDPQDSSVTTRISKQVGDAWKEEKVRPNLPPPRSACPHDPENPDPESAPNPPRIHPNPPRISNI